MKEVNLELIINNLGLKECCSGISVLSGNTYVAFNFSGNIDEPYVLYYETTDGMNRTISTLELTGVNIPLK